MPLGDLGNLHVGIEVDLSGLSAGLAKAEAEMKAAAERMSSSTSSNLGQVKVAYQQAGDAAEQSGARTRSSVQQTAAETERSGAAIRSELGRVAQSHRDTDRDASASMAHISNGLRNLAGAFGDLGPAFDQSFGTLRNRIPALNDAVVGMQVVWSGATGRIGESFGSMRRDIDSHVDAVRIRLSSLGSEALAPFRNAISSIGDTSENAFRRLRGGVDDVENAMVRFGSNGVGSLRAVGGSIEENVEHSHSFRTATEAVTASVAVGTLFMKQRMEEVRAAVDVLQVAFSPLADAGRRAFDGIGEAASGVASRIGGVFTNALSGIGSSVERNMGDASSSVDRHGNSITNSLRTVNRDGGGAIRGVGEISETAARLVELGFGDAGRAVGEGGRIIGKGAKDAETAVKDTGKAAEETGSIFNRAVGGMLQAFGSLVSAVPSLGGVGRIFTTMGSSVAESGAKSGYAIIGIIYALDLLIGVMSFFALQAIGAIFILGVFAFALGGFATAMGIALGAAGLLGFGIVALASSYAGWADSNQKVTEAQSKLDAATKAHQNAIDDLKHQQDAWNQSSTHTQTQLDSLQRAEREVTSTQNDLTKAQNDYNDAVNKSHNPLNQLQTDLKGMKDAWGQAAVPLAGPILQLLDSFIKPVQDIGLGILDWFKGVEPDVLYLVNNLFLDILDVVRQLGPPFAKFFDLMLKLGESQAFQQLEEAGKQFLTSTVAGLLDNLAKLAYWFVDSMPTWGPVVGSIFSAIGQFVQGFGQHLLEIGNWFVQHWPQIIQWTSDLAAMFEKYLPIIAPIVKGIVDLIGYLIKVPEVREGIKDLALIFGVTFLAAILAVVFIVGFLAAVFVGTAAAIGYFFDFVKKEIKFFQDRWDDIHKHLSVVLPAIGNFVGAAFSAIGGFIQGAIGWIGQFFGWIGGLASGVGSAVQGILSWFGNLFSGIGSFIQGVIGWFGQFIGWVGGLASAAGSAVQGILSWFGNLFSGLGSIVNAIVTWVVNAWNWLWGQAGAIFGGIVNGIVFWFTTAWNFISNLWSFIVGWLLGVWNGIWSAVGTFFGGIVNGIVFWFTTAWNFISNLWSFIWGWLAGLWNGILTTAIGWLSGIWNQIVFWFNTAWNFISNLWSFIWGWLAGLWNAILATAIGWLTNLWNQIVFWFTTAWNWLSNLWNFILGWLTGLWNSILATAIQWLTNVWNTIVFWFNTAWNFIQNLWSFIWGWLSGTWNGIWGTANDFFNKIFNTIEYWAKLAWQTVRDWFNGMSDAVHNALSALGQIVKGDLNWIIANVINKFLDTIWWAFHNIPGGGIDLPIHDIGPFAQGGVVGYAQGGIPQYAAGAVPGTNAGVVDRPKLFVAGEAGPETIIPWSSQYRSRAIDLWQMTGRQIGVLGPSDKYGHSHVGRGGVEHFASGGIPTSGHGGQCLEFLSNTIGFARGVPAAKDAAVFCNSNTPSEGEVFIDTGGPFGHAGFVYNGGNVLDSNWGGDEMIRIHPLSDVQGYGPICYVNLGQPYGGASPTGGGGFSFSIQGAVDAAIQAALAGLDAIPHGLFKPVPEGLFKLIGPAFVGWATKNFAAKIAALASKFSGALSGFVQGAMNAADITRLALQAGWSPGDIPGVLCHIAGESGGNPNAIGPAFGGDSGSVGLLQVQPSAHPEFDVNKLRDPLYNLEAGLQIFRAAGGWGPWSVKCAEGGVVGLCEGGVMGLGCNCLSGMGSGDPIPFDTGYNVIPPGLSTVYNGRRTPEALAEVGSRTEQEGGGGGGSDIHNHFHGDVRVSPDLFQEAYRRADWYHRTGQY